MMMGLDFSIYVSIDTILNKFIRTQLGAQQLRDSRKQLGAQQLGAQQLGTRQVAPGALEP